MKNLKVSIIVLNHNGYQMTKDCLKSLLNVNYNNIEIIIIDNGSSDNSAKLLLKDFPNIKIIRNKINRGYAEGNNIGFRAASGDLICFLNNDTLVEKNFISPLIDVLISSEKIGAVQPKIMNYPQIKVIDSIGSYFINSGFLYHYGHNKKIAKKYQNSSDIFSMKGACMLFKREVIDKVGLFEDSYFAYFEETDLCHRSILAGYKIKYVPESVIFHIGGNTASKLPISFIQFHSYKNRIYTYLKNFEPITLLKILPIHLLFCLLISLVYLFSLKLSLSFAVIKAIFWNFYHIRLIKQKRDSIKKIRVLRDQDYLPSLTRKVSFSYYYHLFSTSLAGYEDAL